MILDGYPLSSSAAIKLQKLMKAAAEAYAKTLPSERMTQDELAIFVWKAFCRSHKVENGKWEPLRVISLHGKRIFVGDRK